MIVLNDLTMKEAEEYMKSLGEPSYRGRQLFQNIHKSQVFDLDDMTNFSKDLRERLQQKSGLVKNEIIREFKSAKDGTRKFLIALEDGNIIETVFMPYENRNTLCLSTQVGCKMGCKFCASTQAGFVRNLKAYEMLNQVYLVDRHLECKIDNIVLMGIGEPLDNYEETLRFIQLITDKAGYDLSKRHITLSTCGIAPKIRDLADRKVILNLTISLHNPIEIERRKLMPIGQKYSIEEVISAADYYFKKTGRRVSYEYTVIDRVNNKPEDIEQLVSLLGGKNILINLIPLNPIDEYRQVSARNDQMNKFQKKLRDRGLHVTIRRSMGTDIEGACGQLRRENMR